MVEALAPSLIEKRIQMKTKKKVISKLNKCYSVAPLTYKGEPHILVAAEKQDACYLFDPLGKKKDTLWEGPGGVMSMVQIPGQDGAFLATQEFYSPNDSAQAKIVTVTPQAEGGWERKVLLKLPFVHRFDILKSGGENYLIACTLKSGHVCRDDWSMPGKVYAAKLPANLSVYNADHPLEMAVIADGMLKNHGYYRITEEGRDTALVSCENGVFRFTPPEKKGDEWQLETLLTTPASDATMIDLDGDGELELAVLAPFHGPAITIYKKVMGRYTKVYDYPEPADFTHALWAGTLCGRPTVVVGHRGGAAKLLAICYNSDLEEFIVDEIDAGRGPANAYGYNYKGQDMIVAANRETDEIALYTFA